jgi:hypothetical protein
MRRVTLAVALAIVALCGYFAIEFYKRASDPLVAGMPPREIADYDDTGPRLAEEAVKVMGLLSKQAAQLASIDSRFSETLTTKIPFFKPAGCSKNHILRCDSSGVMQEWGIKR